MTLSPTYMRNPLKIASRSLGVLTIRSFQSPTHGEGELADFLLSLSCLKCIGNPRIFNRLRKGTPEQFKSFRTFRFC